MNIITANEINKIVLQINDDVSLHPASIAYLQTLLTPFATLSDNALIEFIEDWAPMVSPGPMGDQIRTILYQNRDNLKVVKNDMLEYILTEIIDFAGDITRECQDRVISPWDIQNVIVHDEELSIMFDIKEGDKHLPVTVIINKRPFTHMLNEEFTAGILLFSLPTVGDCDFNITMFGAPVKPNVPTRFTPEKLYEMIGYTVDVDRTYYFSSTDFMPGFAIAALWAGVDHHGYWENLTYRTMNEKHTELIETSLTF